MLKVLHYIQLVWEKLRRPWSTMQHHAVAFLRFVPWSNRLFTKYHHCGALQHIIGPQTNVLEPLTRSRTQTFHRFLEIGSLPWLCILLEQWVLLYVQYGKYCSNCIKVGKSIARAVWGASKKLNNQNRESTQLLLFWPILSSRIYNSRGIFKAVRYQRAYQWDFLSSAAATKWWLKAMQTS